MSILIRQQELKRTMIPRSFGGYSEQVIQLFDGLRHGHLFDSGGSSTSIGEQLCGLTEGASPE
jgi:hypothetical protein